LTCAETQRLLTEAELAHAAPEPAARAHAESCTACAAHRRFLARLATDLRAFEPPPPDPAAVAAAREAGLRTLRERVAWSGFTRDLVRALGVALLALPVSIGHALLVGWAASALLGAVLPAPVLAWLGVVYFGSLALALGVLYGSIPVAVSLARRSRLEPT
jgi:hypothetical protein